MLKLLTRVRLFCFLRGEQQEHRDIDKDVFGEPLEECPDFWLPLYTVPVMKIGINDPESDRHGTVPAPFDLCLGMGTLVLRENVQNLLDLRVRGCTAIYTGHSYNRPSAHARIAVAASTKA
jgi:hypothetical protein